MSIKIYRFEDQEPGGFNGGEILENRPIVLTGDHSTLQPYSNLFYWAHAWSNKGSTIGEHPHKAFEIMTFILKGTIEHYDTKNRKWIPLKAGDVQIIRSGSGISHSEKINADSHVFQIWFDPDLNKTITMPATYNDYEAASFPVTSEGGFEIKTYTEDGSNFGMVTPGVSIKEVSFGEGSHALGLAGGEILSAYLIEGTISVNGEDVKENDFITASGIGSLSFTSKGAGKLFIIGTPEKLDYRTYAERHLG